MYLHLGDSIAEGRQNRHFNAFRRVRKTNHGDPLFRHRAGRVVLSDGEDRERQEQSQEFHFPTSLHESRAGKMAQECSAWALQQGVRCDLIVAEPVGRDANADTEKS